MQNILGKDPNGPYGILIKKKKNEARSWSNKLSSPKMLKGKLGR
jgi:hypothetical protein